MTLPMEALTDDLQLPTTAASARHLALFVAVLTAIVAALGAVPIIVLALLT